MAAVFADKAADCSADLQVIAVWTVGEGKLFAAFAIIANPTITMERLETGIAFCTTSYLWR